MKDSRGWWLEWRRCWSRSGLASPRSGGRQVAEDLRRSHGAAAEGAGVAFWGWADAGEEVTVALNGATVTAKAGEDGKWQLHVATPDAGGPHEVVVKGKNEIKLADVLIGEVWICSGQSNMEWPVAASTNAAEEAKNGDHPQIRMIKVAH